MDPLTNPYAPGAGTPPPDLAGRDDVLETASLAIRRSRACRPARRLMLIGLCGAGKTVLLNRVKEMADARGAVTDFFETGTNGPLAHAIATSLRSALLRLDRARSASRHVKRALSVPKSFAGSLRVRYGDIELSIADVDAEPGMADSGTLSRDLADLLIAAGEAARDRDPSIVILIDETQNLAGDDFGALLMAIHRANQARLPVLVVGAGCRHRSSCPESPNPMPSACSSIPTSVRLMLRHAAGPWSGLPPGRARPLRMTRST